MDEADLEFADRMATAERDAGAARAAAQLAGPGRVTCADCGEPIEAARRRAAPFATRCIDCQTQSERRAV